MQATTDAEELKSLQEDDKFPRQLLEWKTKINTACLRDVRKGGDALGKVVVALAGSQIQGNNNSQYHSEAQ